MKKRLSKFKKVVYQGLCVFKKKLFSYSFDCGNGGRAKLKQVNYAENQW
jgi:hypothetical protein